MIPSATHQRGGGRTDGRSSFSLSVPFIVAAIGRWAAWARQLALQRAFFPVGRATKSGLGSSQPRPRRARLSASSPRPAARPPPALIIAATNPPIAFPRQLAISFFAREIRGPPPARPPLRRLGNLAKVTNKEEDEEEEEEEGRVSATQAMA